MHGDPQTTPATHARTPGKGTKPLQASSFAQSIARSHGTDNCLVATPPQMVVVVVVAVARGIITHTPQNCLLHFTPCSLLFTVQSCPPLLVRRSLVIRPHLFAADLRPSASLRGLDRARPCILADREHTWACPSSLQISAHPFLGPSHRVRLFHPRLVLKNETGRTTLEGGTNNANTTAIPLSALLKLSSGCGS
jgi:hypothetical protein